MFSVCLCARCQSNSKKITSKGCEKRILRYIKNIFDYDLFYPKSSTFDLMSYSDADFAGYKSD